MTEAEARAALRAFVDPGKVERWIADQPWQPKERGWTISGERREGWRFWIEPAPGGVRVIMSTGEGGQAAWVVPATTR